MGVLFTQVCEELVDSECGSVQIHAMRTLKMVLVLPGGYILLFWVVWQ